MTLSVTPIPEHVRAQLAAHRGFVLIALNSWRETAFATNALLERNFERVMDEAVSAEERAFLGWEIVTAATELSEIVGTLLLYQRDPLRSTFHAADNPTLKSLFESLDITGISDAEARTFVGLRVPPGLGATSIRVASAQAKVVAKIRMAASDIARFWLTKSDDARWWRHLPMSLTWDEVLVVSPPSDAERETMLAAMEATPERIETLARIDAKQNVYEHTALRLADLRFARGIASIASQLVINSIVNAELDELHSRDKRSLAPFLTRDLTRDEKKVLQDDGNYEL